MRTKLPYAVLCACLAAAACAGPGHQVPPMPAAESAVAADHCRVYIARSDVFTGSTRQVSIRDGSTEIGAIGEGEYLCWDRPAVRGVGTAVFEGFAPGVSEVENVFDLPREPGGTAWIAIEIPHAGRQPQIEFLTSEAGRALIAERKPARHP